MLKFLQIGATGRTGRQLLDLALERGFGVHAIVRDERKIKNRHPALKLFTGNPTDTRLLQEAMVDCNAILSTLNISRVNDFPWSPLRSPKDLLSATMKAIIDAAGNVGLTRIIFTSAWGVSETRKDIPTWFRWLIDHSNIRYPYLDHAVQEELVKASALEWTAVRPTALTNKRKPGKVMVSINNEPRPGLLISRRDTASFMLDILSSGEFIRQAVTISGG